MEEYNIIQSELENIYKIKENGVRIRSRVDNLLQGESNNQFLKAWNITITQVNILGNLIGNLKKKMVVQ